MPKAFQLMRLFSVFNLSSNIRYEAKIDALYREVTRFFCKRKYFRSLAPDDPKIQEASSATRK